MVASPAETLAQLARLKDPGQRQQLALGVTDLCVAQPLSPTAEPVAGELLVTLTKQVPTDSKKAVAEKLSVCDWAPHAAIKHLAFEEIEVASVIIKKSKRLTDQDMVEIAKLGSVDHRTHLARRPNLAVKVTDSLSEPAEPAVLRALANNDTAEISDKTLSTCLTASKDNLKLREALARRHDISNEYATQLAIMLPENWREELYRRFGLDKDAVEKLAVEAALGSASDDKDKLAEKAVNEAADAGKLSGEFALTALKSGDLALFDHAIARLCDVKTSQWRVALAMGGVRAAAMACQAAALDRTAYPVVHRGLQHAGRIHQALEGDAMNGAANIFRMYGKEKAAKVLRQMGSRV